MPKNDNREYRSMMLNIETRAEGDEPEEKETMIVSGYASTFEEPYTLFEDNDIILREVVDKDAFADTDMSDVIMQYNHEGRVIARNSNNTLTVTPDEKGLFIKADLSGTELGRELYEEIRGGYTDKMSFGFTIDRIERTRTDLEDGRIDVLNRILRVSKLYDVSAVSIPANDGTSISVETRSEIDGVIEEARADRLNRAKLELKKRLLKKE